jgi:hypothetical protein
MSQRQLHDRVRRAFSALTRPPGPQLTERVRDSLWGIPAPARRATAGRPLALAALAAVVLLATAAAAMLEGPAVVSTAGQAVRGLQSATARLLAPPRTASTPTPPARPALLPSPTATAATPLPTETPTEPPPSASPPAQPAPPPTAPPAAPPVATLPGFSCAAQAGGGGQATMTTARVGAQSGYDRFVVQFDGPVPQFEVTPQGSAAFAQSGGPVTLQGSAGLAVVLRNASGQAYGGPRDMQPGFSVIQEAKLLSDFQGVVEWGIGIAHPACFHAWTLGSPSRLVVDIAT